MKAQIVAKPIHPCYDKVEAFSEGLKKHGWEVVFEPHHIVPCDLIVNWGCRHPAFNQKDIPYLLLEHGYIGNRDTEWTTAGFGFIANHMKTVDEPDYDRLEALFPNLLQPEKEKDNTVIVFGQVPGDLACQAVDIEDWCARACQKLLQQGYKVAFKGHPRCNKRMRMPERVTVLDKEMPCTRALQEYTHAVAYSSTSLVEAACAGLHVSCASDLSVCWPLQQGMDRHEWAARLVNKQWNRKELEEGYVWEQLEGLYRSYKTEG